MGLFSSKKIINVSSTLYNMAGPEEERPNYLKGTLFSSVMANSSSLADDITKSYFNGPGLKQRSFFRYANRKAITGLPTTIVTNNSTVDPTIVAQQIPINNTAPTGAYIHVINSQISEGDPTPFLERWVLQNHQDRFREDWLGDYEPVTNTFSVQFPNGDFFTFTDNQYNINGRYIEARFMHIIDQDTKPEVSGITTTVSVQKSNLNEFSLISSDGIYFSTLLNRNTEITESFDNGDPDIVTNEDSSITVDLNRSTDVYEKTDLISNSGLQVEGLFQRLTYIGDDQKVNTYNESTVTTEDIGGGVTKTTTTVVTGEEVQIQWKEKLDTQEILETSILYGDEMFIYSLGGGNSTLDLLFQNSDTTGFQSFFPFLPLRINNISINSEPYLSNGLYAETSKAYKRATSASNNISKILTQIEDNPSIGDIDYAYIMYGVSLNVKENACRKYIFKFFENMIPFQNSNSSTISGYGESITAYNTAKDALEQWQQTDWSNTPWELRPPRPTIPALSIPEQTTIRLATQSPLTSSFDVRLQWTHIDIGQSIGNFSYLDPVSGYRNAKKDEVQIRKAPSITWQEIESYIVGRDTQVNQLVDKSIEAIDIFWQIDDNLYRKITVYGLLHNNFIYGGKSVQITSHQALDDADVSGFIIPLHDPTMKAMSIVDYTQMATANTHILFNSYTVTKQKWYQRGFFKVLFIIAIIIVSVTFNPAAFATGGGILGSNVAIGTAIGLTGTAAIVAGVIANYLASLIVAEVLKVAGTEFFGERFGALFSAIAGIAVGAVSTGSFSFDTANILKIGGALANGYSGFVASELTELTTNFDNERKQYETQMEYIDDLISNLGTNDLQFNPMFLTESIQNKIPFNKSNNYLPETSDQFIQRTTMTGSDVVDITYSMVYDFVQIQQTLPRN